jgi:para-nitrobenzyl esterase
MIRWVHFRFFPVALALSLVLLVFNAGCIAVEPVSTEAAAAAKQMMAQIRARYGENKPITDDNYDKSLAVKCVNGTFVGTKTDDVVSYKGIPYVGQQPVGENRFKKPVPFEADEGVYEAYHFAKGCLQPISADDAGSLAVLGEDSLYLNIWKNTADTSEKKPVMVWIHGGGFTQGSTINPLYDGFNFVRDNGDVILVSIAYRLGGLGFLHLSHLPDGADYPDAQNLGILDQVMALRWVHENIAAFGGDPDNVTIFGESAGGCSVTLLPLIPEARSYIRRVIAESGTPAFTSSTEEAIAAADKALKALNCETVADLLALPPEKIADVVGELLSLEVWPERDGNLIPLDPYDAYLKGEASQIDLLEGCNKDEMGEFVHFMTPDGFTEFFTARRENRFAAMSEEDLEKARAFLDNTPGNALYKTRSFGDQMIFITPAFRMSENHTAAGGRTYHYYFRVESSITNYLSGHAAELAAVFNNPQETFFSGRAYDDAFNHTMQRMWVNFAKTGDPSLTAGESPTGKAIQWELYNSDTRPIMVFDEFNVHQGYEPDYGIVDWERTYPLTKYFVF